MEKYTPDFKGKLRDHMILVPEIISQCSGVRIFGKLIKSVVFTTDVAIIRNINANAVIAVYPFTPQPSISQAIISVAEMPVFCGVGGGLTGGKRVVSLARHAEYQGALGAVVNAPTPNKTIEMLADVLDIPIIVTVVSEHTDIQARLNAGANILNISAAANTAKLVKNIRQNYPELPIIATGGTSEQSIQATIDAGANSITYTPPSSAQLFRVTMEKYRADCDEQSQAVYNKRRYDDIEETIDIDL